MSECVKVISRMVRMVGRRVPCRVVFWSSTAVNRLVDSSHGVGFPVNVNKVPFSIRTFLCSPPSLQVFYVPVFRVTATYIFAYFRRRPLNTMSRRTDLDLSDDQRFALMKVSYIIIYLITCPVLCTFHRLYFTKIFLYFRTICSGAQLIVSAEIA